MGSNIKIFHEHLLIRERRYNRVVGKSRDEFPLATYTNELAERLRELVPAALC